MGLRNSILANMCGLRKHNESPVSLDKLPEPAEPSPTDPRLPLNARQIFRLKKSWKGIKRKATETGVELFIR